MIDEYRQNYLNHFQWHLANKLCSENQAIALEDLKLSNRVYKCDCGFEIDRDLNAAINPKNEFLKSAEYVDNRHGEVVRPRRLVYKPQGSFIEVSTNSL